MGPAAHSSEEPCERPCSQGIEQPAPPIKRRTSMTSPLATTGRFRAGHTTAPVIVVGYDGSDESREAVVLAAERAGPDGTVIPVHVMASASSWLGTPFYEREVDSGHHAARAVLAGIDEL